MSDITHLIVLTIGPVQSYISQARRTQDLFQGSRILSYLAEAGAGVAQTYNDASLIYPVVKSSKGTEQGSIPNRLVIAWHGNLADATICARHIQGIIENTWRTISEKTREYFLAGVTGRSDADGVWKQQEQSWLECYWVVVEYDSKSPYADNIQTANAAMGARKLLRDFGSITEDGLKDSITGEHGVLHNSQEETPRKSAIAFWEERRINERNRALLNKSERLGAISTIKRFVHETQSTSDPLFIKYRYPSTSSVAVAPFKYDVLQYLYSDESHDDKKQKLRQTLQHFLQALLRCYQKDGRFKTKTEPYPARDLFFTVDGHFNPEYFYPINRIDEKNLLRTDPVSDNVNKDWPIQFMCLDGDYLFEDTLIPKTIAEYLPPLKRDEEESDEDYRTREKERQIALTSPVRAALNALKQFISAAAECDIAPPQPYFAILSMDGDHMGKTLGTLKDADRHRTFSQILAEFAQDTVERIVEQKYPGRVVYAGGDDVLALLPVRHVLEVAETLREQFTLRLTDRYKFTNKEGNPITASTGIAFVHHTHDLQNAVTAANNAQKHIAKEAYRRNAIGIKLLRRSGEPREMGSKWVVNRDDNRRTIVPAIELLKEAFYHNLLGRSLPYDMARIAYQMDGAIVSNDAIEAELKRVTKRRFASPQSAGYASLPENTRHILGDTYDLCKDRVIEMLIWLVQATSTMTQAQRWVELARFIAQKESDR